jgi:hypothetical protein
MSKIVTIPWNEFFMKNRNINNSYVVQSLSKFNLNSMIPVLPLSETINDFDTISKLDILGSNFLTVARKAGFWVILIAGVTQILRAVNNQDRKQIVETLLTYALMYATLYLLPEAMKLIDSIFG